MSDMAQVSIIIPTKNEEKNLPNLILDLQAQSFQDFEIIIVDDGSKDNSLEILRNFTDNRISIFPTENQSFVLFILSLFICIDSIS